MKSLRDIGRTTRMLEYAKKLHDEGKKVHVIMATHNQVTQVKNTLGSKYLGYIDVCTPDSEFNWEYLFIPRSRNDVTLVDHYAIERHFSSVLSMLHAFDAPENEINELDKCNWE